jgi:hypothetical protein
MRGRFGRPERAAAVIAASVVAILVVGALYLRVGTTLLSYVGANATPSRTPSHSPWNAPCPPTEMSLTGIFQECLSVDIGMSCPTGTLAQMRVMRMHGTKNDFILYVQVDGYRGPGTYTLAAGVGHVALREWSSGEIWESAAASVTIAENEESGWLYAGLGASNYSTVDVKLNAAGWWSCSQARLPPPRGGGSACLPTAGEPVLLDRLSSNGIHVTAASRTSFDPLFPKAASVCLMDAGSESFTVAFFNDSATAMAVKICETRSGARYVYTIDGVTVDSNRELFWSVSGALVLWTDSSALDASLTRALSANRPRC